ncbi:MAG: cell division protein FtsW [Clostridia bacterium]|nr:cell division protein FtsW [Clostridia bacterium]
MENRRQTQKQAEVRPPKRRNLKTKIVRIERTRLRSNVDGIFLVFIVLLLCIGTVMVCSASYAYAQNKYAGDSFLFVNKQLKFVVIGMAIMAAIALWGDYFLVRKIQKFIFYFSLLTLLLVPFIGENYNGATRWINLGPIQVQPSEFVKVTLVMYFADYNVKHKNKDNWLAKRIYARFYPYCKTSRFAFFRRIKSPQNRMKTFWTGIFPYLAFLIFTAILLAMQPHMSGLIIIAFETLIMMILGQCSWKWIGSGILAGGLGMGALFLIKPHAMSRIQTWLTPFEQMTETELRNNAWQPYQSTLAIGSGGLWGVGLGNSRQKHLFLPEPQNDYIFSILCEEMGFIFATVVILLFCVFIWRGYRIAMNAPDNWSKIVVIGIISKIAIQTILNIAVVTNSIPSTGVPLPFFSYGGTALIVLMAEMGLVLNISKYSYIEK